MGSLRSRVVQIAKEHMGTASTKYPTVADMESYFRDANVGYIKSSLETSVRTKRVPVMWGVEIHWCGIFATALLKRAGLNVFWKSGAGIYGQVERVKYEAGMYLEPGDVGAIARKNHHFLILEHVPEYDYLETLDGNQEYQTVKHYFGRHDPSSLLLVYRLRA